ncbi:hypothetical protein [Micromonospora sp. WMMA1996]|uniref:hypothetical protein n=1 Tax=Micromonospora sp. WMMA1996 TaxID=2039878 RepID=UPI0020D2673F|nr:hypothetical protein [Micromonospora sp. WMMA1996]
MAQTDNAPHRGGVPDREPGPGGRRPAERAQQHGDGDPAVPAERLDGVVPPGAQAQGHDEGERDGDGGQPREGPDAEVQPGQRGEPRGHREPGQPQVQRGVRAVDAHTVTRSLSCS